MTAATDALFTHVVIRPALWRLSLRHNSRIFQNAARLRCDHNACRRARHDGYGFAATRVPRLSGSTCVQYRETDLAFIERLAAEGGLLLLSRVRKRRRRRPPAGIRRCHRKCSRSVGERTYHSRAGGTRPRRHLRKLRQVTARVRPATAMLKDYTFQNPAYAQLHEHLPPGVASTLSVTITNTSTTRAATRRMLPASRLPATDWNLYAPMHWWPSAESDLPELAPGMCFTLTDHDIAEPQSATGRYWPYSTCWRAAPGAGRGRHGAR